MKSAMKTQARTQSPDPVALGMKSMLGAIAEQRQAQLEELNKELQRYQQHAQDLPYVYKNRAQKAARSQSGQHRREQSTSWGGAWGHTSDTGTAHSNHAAGGASWGGVLGTGETVQASNGNGWGETGTSSGANSKSKKKRNKKEESNAKGHDGGWGAVGGESSWAGGWDTAGAASTSVTQGGFGATTNGAWGTADMNATDAGGWGNTDNTQAQSQTWGSWDQQGTQGNTVDEKMHKVILAVGS